METNTNEQNTLKEEKVSKKPIVDMTNLNKKQIRQLVSICIGFIVFFCIGYVIYRSIMKNNDVENASTYDSLNIKGMDKLVECELSDTLTEFVTMRYDYDYLTEDRGDGVNSSVRFPADTVKIDDGISDTYFHEKYVHDGVEYDLFTVCEMTGSEALDDIFYSLGLTVNDDYLLDKATGYYNGYCYNYYSFVFSDDKGDYTLFVYDGLDSEEPATWQLTAVGAYGIENAQGTYDLLNRITDTAVGYAYTIELPDYMQVTDNIWDPAEDLAKRRGEDYLANNSSEDDEDFSDAFVHPSHEFEIDLDMVYGSVGYDAKYKLLHISYSKGDVKFLGVSLTNKDNGTVIHPTFYNFNASASGTYGELFIDLSTLNREGKWVVNLETYDDLEYVNYNAATQQQLDDVSENGVIYERASQYADE